MRLLEVKVKKGCATPWREEYESYDESFHSEEKFDFCLIFKGKVALCEGVSCQVHESHHQNKHDHIENQIGLK